MKTLVVFYSRSGNTRKLALEIKKCLKADLDEIKSIDRKGAWGFLMAGKDSVFNKTIDIKYKKDPSKYNLVVIGTPVWTYTMAPAIRTYLIQNKGKFKKVAFFCTMNSSGDKITFKNMERLSKKPVATLSALTWFYRNLKKCECSDKIKKFCREAQ
jgi:flavodoxin